MTGSGCCDSLWGTVCQNEKLPLVLKADSGSRLMTGTLCLPPQASSFHFLPTLSFQSIGKKWGQASSLFFAGFHRQLGHCVCGRKVIPLSDPSLAVTSEKASGDVTEGGRGVLEVISSSHPGMVESNGSKGHLGLVALVMVGNQ